MCETPKSSENCWHRNLSFNGRQGPYQPPLLCMLQQGRFRALNLFYIYSWLQPCNYAVPILSHFIFSLYDSRQSTSYVAHVWTTHKWERVHWGCQSGCEANRSCFISQLIKAQMWDTSVSESHYWGLQSIVSLWPNAAVAAVMLPIYICSTVKGGYKRPEDWPFQDVCLRAHL